MRNRCIGLGILAIFALVCVCAYKMALFGKPRLQTQLFVGIWQDDAQKVEEALRDGADPNGPSTQLNQPTPIMDASRLGHLEIVRILLAKKADPNKPDRSGRAALYYVFDNGALGGRDDRESGAIVKLLIANGADLSARGVREAASALPRSDPRYEAWENAISTVGNRDRLVVTNQIR